MTNNTRRDALYSNEVFLVDNLASVPAHLRGICVPPVRFVIVTTSGGGNRAFANVNAGESRAEAVSILKSAGFKYDGASFSWVRA